MKDSAGYVFGFLALALVGGGGYALYRHSQRQDAVAKAEIEAIKSSAAGNRSASGGGGPFAAIGRGVDAIAGGAEAVWDKAKKWF